MNIQLKKTELEEHTQTIDGHYIYGQRYFDMWRESKTIKVWNQSVKEE